MATQAKIVKLKESMLTDSTSEDEVYPVTHVLAVYDSSDTDLGTILEDIRSGIYIDDGVITNNHLAENSVTKEKISNSTISFDLLDDNVKSLIKSGGSIKSFKISYPTLENVDPLIKPTTIFNDGCATIVFKTKSGYLTPSVKDITVTGADVILVNIDGDKVYVSIDNPISDVTVSSKASKYAITYNISNAVLDNKPAQIASGGNLDIIATPISYYTLTAESVGVQTQPEVHYEIQIDDDGSSAEITVDNITANVNIKCKAVLAEANMWGVSEAETPEDIPDTDLKKFTTFKNSSGENIIANGNITVITQYDGFYLWILSSKPTISVSNSGFSVAMENPVKVSGSNLYYHRISRALVETDGMEFKIE